jgi:small subunit ribosomal protein S9
MVKKIEKTSSKRKTSIARATVKPGKGVVRINSTNLDVYEPELARKSIKEALVLAGDLPKKVNIKVNVRGGGWQSQAEAVRLAIAKGLVEFSKDPKLKQTYLDYDRYLLVADVRRTEPQKPYRSAPRAKRQKSKR